MQFIWPLHDHIVTRGFYYLASLYVGGQHAAIDLVRGTGPTRAAPIMAVADGVVVGVGWDIYSGFFVAVDHVDGFRSFYRHLYGQTPVIVGQRVSQGQIIGNVGNTGASLGDHLHFDLWNSNKIRDDNAIFYKNGWYAVDPVYYLGQEDEMTPEEKAELGQLRTDMNTLLGHGPHYTFEQVRDNLPGLNQHIEGLVRAIAREVVGENNASPERFKQIADNLPDLNQHVRNIVQGMIGDADGYSDEQAVKAVKDALPG